jgi:hypothetical protein
MPTLADIYEEQAKECPCSAARADDPKRREMLLKLASVWREDAERLKRGEEPHKPRVRAKDKESIEGAPSDAPAPARKA